MATSSPTFRCVVKVLKGTSVLEVDAAGPEHD